MLNFVNGKLKIIPKKSYDISAVFPEECNPDIIVANTVKNLDDVVDASVIDTYQGSQIPDGKYKCYLKYEVINSEDRFQR